MVDRDLPGISMEQLAGAQAGAIATAQQMREDGEQISYLRSTFVPGESHCMCLFEAASEEAVRRLNDRAGLPYTRVTQALDLTP
jgi:hypothetical protein